MYYIEEFVLFSTILNHIIPGIILSETVLSGDPLYLFLVLQFVVVIGRRNIKSFETRILPSRNLEKCKRPYFLSHDFFERFFHEIFLRDFLRYLLILRDFFREISSRDFIEEFLDFFFNRFLQGISRWKCAIL